MYYNDKEDDDGEETKCKRFLISVSVEVIHHQHHDHREKRERGGELSCFDYFVSSFAKH